MTQQTLPPKKNNYSYDDLIACGKGELFGKGNAKLPQPPLLMFDRITDISEEGNKKGQGQMVATLDIKPDLWFFNSHFQDDPVMPGCLGLDAMWQLVGFYLAWTGALGRGRALGTSNVNFKGQVTPTSKLVQYEINIRRVFKQKSVTVGLADGCMLLDGEIIYAAKNLRVGLFINTLENF